MSENWEKKLAENARNSAERERQDRLRRQEQRTAEAKAEKDNEMRLRLRPMIAHIMRSDAKKAAKVLKAANVKTIRTSNPSEDTYTKVETRPREHPRLTKGSLIKGIISRLGGNTEYLVTEHPKPSDIPTEAWSVKSNGYHHEGGNSKTGSSVGSYMVSEWIGLAKDGSLHEFWGDPKTGYWSHHRILLDSTLVPIEHIYPMPPDQLPLENQSAVTAWRQTLGNMVS